jgi:hypothetical protein
MFTIVIIIHQPLLAILQWYPKVSRIKWNIHWWALVSYVFPWHFSGPDPKPKLFLCISALVTWVNPSSLILKHTPNMSKHVSFPDFWRWFLMFLGVFHIWIIWDYKLSINWDYTKLQLTSLFVNYPITCCTQYCSGKGLLDGSVAWVWSSNRLKSVLLFVLFFAQVFQFKKHPGHQGHLFACFRPLRFLFCYFPAFLIDSAFICFCSCFFLQQLGLH